MSALGDLLELLHTSARRWRTVQAEGWEWRDDSRMLAAWARAFPDKHARVATCGADPGHRRPPVREPWRLWHARPDRTRAEFAFDDEAVNVVIVGDTWWSWSRSRPLTTNQGDPDHSHGIGPAAALLDPAPILPAVDLAVAGRRAFAGRPTLAVIATPTPVDEADEEHHDWLGATHGLGVGADEYALLVDADTGMLLRSDARLDGRPFRTLEVERVVFDDAVPPETFEPPAGRAVEPPQTPGQVRLSAVGGEVAFVVLVPEHPPFGPDEAEISPAEPRYGTPEQVHIHYASNIDGEEHRRFALVQAADPLPDRPGVEWRDHDGIHLGEDQHPHPPLRVVRLQRHGTHVELQTHNLEPNELLDLARSLVPLPQAPDLDPNQ